MKEKTKHKAILCITTLVVLMGFLSEFRAWAREPGPARISLLLATGLPGSLDYQVGLGLASLWTTRLKNPGIRVSAAVTEGARENIEAIRIGDADLIIADEHLSFDSFSGKGPFKDKPLTQLRAITVLWPEILHLIIRSDRLNSGSIRDLEGLALGLGLGDGSVRQTLELLLKETLGSKRAPKLKPMSNSGLIEAWKSGAINAVAFSGSLPSPVVNHFIQQNQGLVRFLSISDVEMIAPNSESTRDVPEMKIPAGTYLGQEQEIRTIGQYNILFASNALDTEVVYELTRTIFSNMDYLAKINPVCAQMSLERASSGLKIPIHRGALKFFREKNLHIRDDLVSD